MYPPNSIPIAPRALGAVPHAASTVRGRVASVGRCFESLLLSGSGEGRILVACKE